MKFPVRKSKKSVHTNRARTMHVEMLEGRLMFSANSPEPLAGDYDHNDLVDGNDLTVWQTSYGLAEGGLAADGDHDGDVDGNDFFVWQRNLGASLMNLPPEASDDSVEINSEQTAVLIPSQMLANDYDPEGSELSITGISNISGGTAELRQGLVFFTPDDLALPLSFDYTVSDSASLETTAPAIASE